MESSVTSTDLNTLIDSASALYQVLLVAGVVLGLLLWLLGGKLGRPGCSAVGLIVASGAAMFVCGDQFSQTVTLGIIIGCGITGGLVALLLFRVWMAISCALILALAVPLGSLVWSQTLPPQLPTVDVNHLVTEAAGNADPWAGVLDQLKTQIGTWWQQRGASGRRTLVVAAGIGMAIGLLTGLIFPYLAASIQAALVGSTLAVSCGVVLIKMQAGELTNWLPDTHRSFLITVGLITLIGLVLQWTILRRKADR